MKKRKIIVVTILFFSLLMNLSINCIATDNIMTTHQEELGLLDKYLVCRRCKESVNDDCEKYLLRFDGIELFVNELKKFLKDNKYSGLKYKLEKAAIGTVSASVIGAGLYFIPIGTTIATVAMGTALPLVCAVNNEIIKPSGEAIGITVAPGLISGIKASLVAFIAKKITKFKNWLFNEKPFVNTDRGLVGNTLDILCGDETKKNHNEGILEGIRKLIFGDISIKEISQIARKKVYNQILDDLKIQIKNGHFKNKDAVRIFLNITNCNEPESVVKFIKTAIVLDYPKQLEDYFKNLN